STTPRTTTSSTCTRTRGATARTTAPGSAARWGCCRARPSEAAGPGAQHGGGPAGPGEQGEQQHPGDDGERQDPEDLFAGLDRLLQRGVRPFPGSARLGPDRLGQGLAGGDGPVPAALAGLGQ